MSIIFRKTREKDGKCHTLLRYKANIDDEKLEEQILNCKINATYKPHDPKLNN